MVLANSFMSDHLKYAGDKLSPVIAKLINAMLIATGITLVCCCAVASCRYPKTTGVA